MPQPRSGRIGNRWENHRPTGEELAEWFKTVPLHKGLKHEDYIGGITLIPQMVKEKEVSGFNQQGQPLIVEKSSLVYTPYPSVAARIKYFQDYNAVQEDVVAILQVDPPPGGVDTYGLPEGFFKYVAANASGQGTNFIGYSTRVRVYRKGTIKFADVRQGKANEVYVRRVAEGELVAEYAAGTKITAVSGRYGVDENAPMKAQTGAVGRALGMAGFLTLPGSTVATADDMHEFLGGGPATPEAAALPSAAVSPPADPDPERHLLNLTARLREAGKLEEFQAWCTERKITMADATRGELVTAIKKAEKILMPEKALDA